MRSLFVIFLFAGFASGAEPPIRLPESPPIPVPAPPGPAPVTTLGPAETFVVDSSVDCVVLVSPADLVTVTEETGPLRMRGQFAGGGGKVETKNFKGPKVFLLEPVADGRCEVLVIPTGAKTSGEVIRRTIDVKAGKGPKPPPDPPGPQPGPAPIPLPGFRALIVYETADLAKLTKDQTAILYAVGPGSVREYLQAKCVAGSDGTTKEYRVWDQNTVVTAAAKHWQDVMARPRASVPWLVVSNGVKGFEGPLPPTPADTLKILKQYGE